MQERDSRVGGPEACVDGSGTGAHSPLGPGRPRRWEREAAAAGRTRGAGCRCGGGRLGAPGALRGAGRRGRAGGLEAGAVHCTQRAPRPLLSRVSAPSLPPAAKSPPPARGTGARAPAAERPDLKETRGDDGL